MAITINFNAETIVGNFCLGRIGEHNATELVITVPTALSGDPRTESYRVAFHTNGQTILSESYTESPITISLWRQLTLSPRLSLQVIAYDGAGDFVGKSVKLSGFYFEPSVMGDSVEADGSNPDLAHEILDIMAKNEEQDTRLDSDESAITALQNGKVDKVDGKGLSTEDYTTAEKEKLATLQNYVLPTASTSTLGGVKVDGETITITNGVIKATVQAGDYVRILTVTNGTANYGAGWLKQFHEEGKIVVYDECILEYSTETTNTIVYYYFDVKNSKQKKLTVTNSKDATIFEVQTYASNNQGISGTIKTLNEWLSQFNTDIGTLQVSLSTVQTSLANKQEKFVEVTFTPTNSADWTQGGTFDKTFSEMAAAVSNGNMLTLKVDGSANFHALQVGGASSSTYWWFVFYSNSFWTIALHHTLPDDEVQVYKFKYASDSVTIDGTTKTVAEWITQLEGYNTITIGQQTHTVEWWINDLRTNKANNLVQIDQATKSIGEWLAWILDGQSIDRFSEVESALNTLSSQIANKIDEPSSAGTEGQVLSLDSNLNPVWANQSGGNLPTGQNVDDILMWNGTQWQSFSRERIAYTPLNYIQSQGSQFIKLSFVPTNKSRVKIHFKLTDTISNDGTPFGEKKNSGSPQYQYNLCVWNNVWYFDFGTASVNLGSYNSSVEDYVIDINKNKITFNGVEHTITDNVFTASYPINIFNRNLNGSPYTYSNVKMKLLSFEAWEDADDAKTLDLVPRRNIFTDKYGMLNLLDYHFYGNDGSGDFTGN